MKHADQWNPSKYLVVDGKLVPSRNAGELAPSSRLMARLLTDRYGRALAAHARGRLLDLGCGKVPLYAAYRAYVEEIVCVDWPGSKHGGLHVDKFCDLSRPLPFADATFDTVLSSDVLEHLPDPELAFREMSRVLRPGGVLILNTPFLYMLHEVPHDFLRHTRYSLERLSSIAGLQVHELDELGGMMHVLADLVGKAISVLPGVGGPIAIAVQEFTAWLANKPFGRRITHETSQRFPLGYFLVACKAAA